ncbi:hypothetical protein Bca4012_045010 [Brassica carinata]
MNMINNGFLFIYPFRKMIVLSSVSCNANLGKVERTVLNFSMIPHHALRLCLKEKRSRACVHIYSMMSMHEEAVALSVPDHARHKLCTRRASKSQTMSSNGDKGITDLKSALQNIFAETIVDNKDEFMKTFSTEKDFIRNMVSNGEVVHSGVIDRSSIDAQVAPEFLFYKFYRYPDRLRMRLSQILVLPSFQGKGFGSYLVEVVNKVATAENVYDLTVEEPSEKFQHIRTCIDINRLRAFDPIKPAIDSAVETLTKGKLSKKAQIPRFTPPLNAIDKVRETLKINKKHFLKCWEILIYLALDPIDKYLDDYTSVITNHVRAGILGKDIEAPKKQVVDVPTSYAAEASFVVFKSLSGEANNGNDVQVDENKPDQEEQLKQLVEERIREIKLVAGKVSKLRI